MLLRGKCAVITGAGGRIGKAAAFLLAQEGASVVVNDHGVPVGGGASNPAVAEDVARAIREKGGTAVANADSVATAEGAERIIRACVDSFGRIDILVNCAMIIVNNLIVDTLPEDWDWVMGVHARGTFLCSKYAAQRMCAQGGGRIVNFTSSAGLTSYPGSNAYSMAKAGITALTWMLAQEVAFYGVTVNAIAPAVVIPRRESRPGVPDIITPEAVRRVRQAYGIDPPADHPAKTLPAEPVAALVAYLASEEAQYINGQVIGASADRIDLWSRPEVVRSAFQSGGWDLQALRARFRSTLGTGLENPPIRLPD